MPNKKKSSFEVSIDDDLIEQAVESVKKHQKDDADPAESQAADVEVEVEHDQAEDQAATDERFVRLSADFENFRRRHHKEKQDMLRYGAETFLKRFLPVLDNLERAIAQTPDEKEFEPIKQGLDLIVNDMMRVFKEQGIKQIDPVGETFDPLFHEAMDMRESEDEKPGSILHVHLKGYVLWDRLLRPASVTVAQAKQKSTSEEDSAEENE